MEEEEKPSNAGKRSYGLGVRDFGGRGRSR